MFQFRCTASLQFGLWQLIGIVKHNRYNNDDSFAPHTMEYSLAKLTI